MNEYISFVAPSVSTALKIGSVSIHNPHSLIARLAELPTRPQELYYSLFTFGDLGPSGDFKGYRGIHGLSLDELPLDFDCSENPRRALEDAEKFIHHFGLEHEPSWALFSSGSKGYHLHLASGLFGDLLAPDTELSARIKRFVQSLATDFPTLDTSIYDIQRKFRAPFSIHPKTGKLKSLERGHWPMRPAAAPKDGLMNAFMAAQYLETKTPTLQHDTQTDGPVFRAMKTVAMKPCIKHMLAQNYRSGERHKAFQLIVNDLYTSGNTVPEIRALVHSWCLRNNPEERIKELESHLADLTAGREYLYGCTDPLRVVGCKSSCAVFKTLSGETLASRPVPLDQKTAEKQQEKGALVRIKQFAMRITRDRLVVYVPETDQFYAYDEKEKLYKPHDPLKFTTMLEEAMPEVTNNKAAQELVGALKRRCGKPLDEFEASTEGYINFQNGHFNKKTARLEGRNINRHFTYCLPFHYNPDAEAPAWSAFLDACFLDRASGQVDVQCKQVLEEFAGATLSGEPNHFDKMLLAVGMSGANGKGTIWNVMRHIIGSDGYSSLDVGMLANPKERETLSGKLANLSGEENINAFVKNEAALKSLSSRDAVTFRPLWKKAYSAVNRAKLWMACNEVPTAHDDSGGWRRRFIILRFNNKAVDAHRLQEETQNYKHGHVYLKDIHLEAKLIQEAPGIFNRAWSAYAQAKARGALTEPNSSSEELESMSVGDPLEEALHALFEQGTDADTLTSLEVMGAVNEFMQTYNVRNPPSGKRVIQTVRRLFVAKAGRTSTQRLVRGIKKRPSLGSAPSF